MRSIALALILSACSGGEMVDPHASLGCDQAWVNNGFNECEAACVDSAIALGAMGQACQATIFSGSTVSCSKTFAFQGVTGCCAADRPRILFAECQ
ncbi:MAG: hypothetical protein H6Q90_5572 [Deltaproteobacteria bacterium]|nr:hypothetical protein [Deltaproteobacteria bacterium]